MNKFLLLKMYLRRGDRSLVRQLFYQLSGKPPETIKVPEEGGYLRTHVVSMKSHLGDKFAVTDAEGVGEVYKGLPVLSLSDLRRVGELCHE